MQAEDGEGLHSFVSQLSSTQGRLENAHGEPIGTLRDQAGTRTRYGPAGAGLRTADRLGDRDVAYGQEWHFRQMLEEAGVGYVLAVPNS